jgi:hypothetical protein
MLFFIYQDGSKWGTMSLSLGELMGFHGVIVARRGI